VGVNGVLTDNTALTAFTGGDGSNFIDISNLTTVAAVNLVKIDDSASPTTATNTVVLNNAVVAGTAALTNMTNVQVIGDSAPAGTVNWANMPTSATTLEYFGIQTAAVTVNGAPAAFDLWVLGNNATAMAITVNAATPSGSGTFEITLGNESYVGGPGALANKYDFAGELTAAGYGTDTITSDGTAAPGFTVVAPFTENIVGNGADAVAASVTGAPIVLDVTGPANLLFDGTVELTGNGSSIVDTNTTSAAGLVWFDGATDAVKIDMTASGGLLMGAESTGNSGATGVTILGSATGSNFIIGSAGNDTLTGGAATDSFVTDGGSDAINLGTGHHNDSINLFNGAAGAFPPVPGGDAVASGADGITALGDVAQPGYWGIPAGGVATNIATLFGAVTGGTSASIATVSAGFIAGSGTTADHLSFSVSQWAVGGTDNGLVDGNLAHIAATPTPLLPTTPYANGAILTGGTQIQVLDTGASITTAATLAAALQDGSFALSANAAFVVGDTYHFLVAYNSGSSTNIADVDVLAAVAHAGFGGEDVYASDMVHLTGVPEASLTASNFHLVA
jgi:RTX calcium-binding nonapeptide repeat (4 copies)